MIEMREKLQTIEVSFREICEGEDPWVPLGNFLNDFFGNYPERREGLVSDPLQKPENLTPDGTRWAGFCAATVEHLCQKYGIPCPAWVNDPAYMLAEPWYYSLGAHKPSVRARLERETPEPFTRRNIYCGNRMFVNKYELALERRSA